jgi:hypothetical protein
MRAISTVLLLATMTAASSSGSLAEAQTSETLRSPDLFFGIADRAARSRAVFGEVAKVLTGPRCMNCHPAGDHTLRSVLLFSGLGPFAGAFIDAAVRDRRQERVGVLFSAKVSLSNFTASS